MKEFFKYTGATILGIFVTSIIMFFIGIVSVVGLLSSSETEIQVSDNSILCIDLNGTISERSIENPLSSFGVEEEVKSYGLEDILSAIGKAENETKIKGIYLSIGTLEAAPATLEEIRNKLEKFKESGKFIYAYSDNYSQGAYYLSSVADKVFLNPSGTITWLGISSQFMSYKGLLDKIGVKMQIFKVGTYKSAVEPYIMENMSEANREQVKAFTSSIWDSYLSAVSKSRGISKEKLNQYADEGLIFAQSETFVKNGMVDSLIYRNDMEKFLKKQMDVEEDDDLNTLSLEEMKNVKRNVPRDKSGNIIAVYYAYGEIDDSKGEENIGALRVIKDLKRIEEDDNIKALVIRVNSPGGSAFGSEQIWKQIKDIKLKKPVVVSMGDYAASGGYYISCNADYIFAQKTTLTGSIGIFGMIPEASELIDKTGLNFETVSTNKFGGAMTITQPLAPEAAALLQKHINEGYELFVTRCADGRKVGINEIKEIAEGRVWTGEMAKKLNLVDEIGGMDSAIEKAKELAEIESYSLVSYPEKPGLLSSILGSIPTMSMQSFGNGETAKIVRQIYELKEIDKINPIQARLPFYIEIH